MLAAAICALACVVTAAGQVPPSEGTRTVSAFPATTLLPAPPAAPASSTTPRARSTTPPAAEAPAGLPVIDYWTAPHGFPADPTPLSSAPVTEGLHPTASIVVYDAPGGRPRARLKPAISGMPFTAPIIARDTGWVAVLLPSINRRMGWLPTGGWVSRPLPDQLVVRRRTHRLTWLHHGVSAATWTVATGTAATPTPLGRTFVLGRTRPHGVVYAGLDALALGSVPEDRAAVAHALRRAHTGIHSWYRSDAFGRSASNGCVRLPRAAQRTLLTHIAAGTTVTIVD
jgi:hypothetical protein